VCSFRADQDVVAIAAVEMHRTTHRNKVGFTSQDVVTSVADDRHFRERGVEPNPTPGKNRCANLKLP
jgi:hypothetical protein